MFNFAQNKNKMKNILVPIGSSENAHYTLQYAIDLAKELNSEVFVFRAYNVFSKAGTMINMDEFIEKETKLYLRGVVNSVNTRDVVVKLISAKGSPLETIKNVDKELGIDLIVLSTKSNSINENAFVGSTSGSIVKQTEIPSLIVPESYQFRPIKNILTAFKSGVINKSDVLNPLEVFLSIFSAQTNLLLVKTPGYTEEDLVIDPRLDKIKSTLTVTENTTTYQGVLSHCLIQNPDLLCVFRRKRGFFKKLWEKNTILKAEFNCPVPLLVLSGKQ